MAASKSQKIQAEIDKVKVKISEQQARLKELEQKHREAENEEIVDIVRGMSVSPVSYTHLDVYKRQVPDFWTKCPEVGAKGG